MPSIIKSCSCNHAFQDEMYGKGRRVFNIAGKSNESAVCTVCEKRVAMSKINAPVTEKSDKKTKVTVKSDNKPKKA